jgi:hypothetical protein
MVAAGSADRHSHLRIIQGRRIQSDPAPPFRHHCLARDSDGLNFQEQSLQALNGAANRDSGDDARTHVSKSETRIAMLKTLARTISTRKSRHFFAVVPIHISVAPPNMDDPLAWRRHAGRGRASLAHGGNIVTKPVRAGGAFAA